MRKVYLDHSATSYVLPEVLEAMLPYFGDNFGNPSSVHAVGRSARRALDDCRDRVADLMGVAPDEVIFTGGGSEADNLAIIGTLFACGKRGKHIVTSTIEHHAVLHTCEFASEHLGAEVTYVHVDKDARVDLDRLEASIRDDTVLVTLMSANNEVGTIQDLGRISEICERRGARLHTDAVQSIGLHDLGLDRRPIGLASASAHKFYGPKGVGFLVKRKKVKITPLIHGGSQEFGFRAGTENIAGIVGLTQALEFAITGMDENVSRLTALRDKFVEGVQGSIDGTSLNGHPVHRLPHNAHIAFEGADGESILLRLDMEGIAASGGSACTSGSVEPSHVLAAMGLDPDLARRCVRFTLGRRTTDEDIDYVLGVLPGIVEKLRGISAAV